MSKKLHISVTGWYLITILLLAVFIFLKMRSDLNNLSNYEITTCYNTENYSDCIYGVTRWQGLKAASAYGSDKDCVESRVESIDGRYNIYFRRCNLFQR